MRVNHKIINKSQLSIALGFGNAKIKDKIRTKKFSRLEGEDKDKLKEVYTDFFTYLLEIEENQDALKLLNSLMKIV